MTSPEANDTLATILERKLIAVLRLNDPGHAVEIVDAMADGGITTIEVTLTTPGGAELIGRISKRKELLVGAGTVLTRREAEEIFDAGARFYASPVLDRELVELAHARGRIAMPGAYTPTEIIAAERAGADLIKIFPMPADPISFLRALRGPFPSLRLAPSGGVSTTTAAELVAAGAAALNVGSWLTHGADGALLPVEEVRDRAQRLVEAVSA